MLGLADRRNQRIIAESRQHVFVILNERFLAGRTLSSIGESAEITIPVPSAL